MEKKDEQEAFRQCALRYHAEPTPGKVAMQPTTGMATQRDLALAYSPGVAAPCEEIFKDPLKSYDYTSRGNVVAVISNGTAILGLGNLGPLASKPVMEGKAVLFKKFANIDAVDVEIDETDVDKLVDIISSLEPTYGGINLEDFKAPECFELERRLREKMNIPVFHDDQHGTAIIVTAAFTNWLHHTGHKIEDIRLVASGAGAAAIACLNLLVHAGLKRENIIICDSKGVVHDERDNLSKEKAAFAVKTDARTLDDAIAGADAFLGLSGPGTLTKEMAAKMADAPLIMALANPVPEIMPADAYEVQPNAIVCTGRSDFPNQVNNVLCFPFLFRGALDVGATTINEEMKLACVKAIAELARKQAVAEVTAVYSDEDLTFGPDYLIPKPFDPRLIVDLPLTIAKAAMDSGVATRPIKDFDEYKKTLERFYFRSQLVMGPIYSRAKENPKRVAYCEGEKEQVLRAAQVVLDENLARPTLIGRENVIREKIDELGLRMEPHKDFDLVDPQDDTRHSDYSETYYSIMSRKGVTPEDAKNITRTNTTVIGSLMVYKDAADAVICGTQGQFHSHLKDIMDIIGLKAGVETPAALSPLVMNRGTFFYCDTQINTNPSIAQISEMTLQAAEEVRRFGIRPKVALLSHSNFGMINCETSEKMRAAYEDIRRRDPDLEIDGEMQADTALIERVRQKIMPNSNLTGQANTFIFPSAESANIAFNMVKTFSEGISIGPILLGAARPAHILKPSSTTRAIVNISSLATVGAQFFDEDIADSAPHKLVRSA